MNTSDQAIAVQLNQSLFGSSPTGAWDILADSSLPLTGSYFNFVLQPLSGSYLLLVSEPPPLLGDYNGDDFIDAADYTVWRDAMTAGSTVLLNDPTPGTVDESDFLYWRDHFGQPGGGAASGAVAGVPEPSCWCLALIGITAWATLRRRT
jgi:hypothetical protein